MVRLLLLFIVVLGITLAWIEYRNVYVHRQVRASEDQACVADQQLAANQRRVILSILSLSEVEKQAHDRVESPEIKALRDALLQVPTYNCERR